MEILRLLNKIKTMRYFEIIKGHILGFFPKLKDGKYKIVEVKRIRSPEQNRTYWGFIIKVITLQYQEAGYLHTKDYIHKQFKKCFLTRERIQSDFSKKYVYKYVSTTKLNTKQFSDFISKIKALCEFGKLGEVPKLEPLDPFVIPDIGEDELLEYIDKVI